MTMCIARGQFGLAILLGAALVFGLLAVAFAFPPASKASPKMDGQQSDQRPDDYEEVKQRHASKLTTQALTVDFCQDGRVVLEDEVRGLYIIACSQGAEWACDYAEWMSVCSHDREATSERFSKYCDQGHSEACVVAGWAALQDPLGVYDEDSADPAAARSLFDRACEAGTTRGCTESTILETRETGTTSAVARVQLGSACDQGDGRACTELGLAYREGRGLPVDLEKAQDAFRRGQRRDPASAYWLAMSEQSNQLWENGSWTLEGFRPSNDGPWLLSDACKAGHIRSCGIILETPDILLQSSPGYWLDHAQQILETGCAANVPEACLQLGMLARLQGEPDARSQTAPWYEQACDARLELACRQLAHECGGISDDSRRRACRAQYMQNACEAGHRDSCIDAIYAVGDDPAAQIESMVDGCLSGDPRYCPDAGFRLSSGRTPPGLAEKLGPDITAEVLYSTGCEAGLADVCFEFAERIRSGHVDADPSAALQGFERACSLGHPKGCLQAGFLLHGGEPEDAAAALPLFETACRGGAWRGCYELGAAHVFGQGASQDADLAREWLLVGCRHDEGNSCALLGEFKEHGIGCSPDLDAAIEFYRRACDHDGRAGCERLGFLHADGIGVEQDDARAVFYLEYGLCGQCPEAMARLADLLAEGRGTSLDIERARTLYRSACDQGLESACSKLEVLDQNPN